MTYRMKHVFLIIVTFSLLLACTITDQLAEPTPTATFPPIPQTAIPQPTLTSEPTAIPGWKKFEGAGFELWLPESYEGGTISDDLDLILERMAALGPEFERASQLLAQNPDVFIFYALESNMGADGFITNVNIFKEQVASTFTIEQFIEGSISQFPATMQVIDTEILTINQYPAGKIEVQYELEGRTIQQVMCLFLQGTAIWGVTYSTSMVDFGHQLPMFEQSISTFKITQ